ncbi:ABC transporter transmembrane domain-containing protein [Aquimarina sp. 2-A2]|uniref:ABC transporter transmembrane domain-containing protein n=1 Tax=Aquimarina sp. 2-A2 TaxID=3382644 RepID=UPI00387F05E4
MIFESNKHLIKQFILQRKSRTFWIILTGMISNVFTIIIPVSIGRYYQLAFNFEAYRLKLIGVVPVTMWNTIPKFLLVFLFLIIIRYISYFIHQYFLRVEGEIFVKNVKDFLFSHQLQIINSVYKQKGIGKFLLRYSGDINSLKRLYLKGTISAIVDGFMIIFALAWLYHLNDKGAIAIVVLSLVFYIVIRFLNKKVETYSLRKRDKTSGQLSLVSRTLNSISTVVINNKQRIELKKYRKKSKGIMDAAFKFNKWSVLNAGFISFAQYAILSVVLYIFYVDLNEINPQKHGGELISFILLYITILPVMRRLFSLEKVYKLGNISLNKLNNIIDIEKEEINLGKTLKVKNPRVVFDNVKFKECDPINFTSKKMEFSSLVMPKGIEEKYIISAMARLDDTYDGEIKINTNNIKEFSPVSLRDNISFCSKEIPLIGRTVYETITAYRSNKIKDDVKNFFLSCQSSFGDISTLALDDTIGENGSSLSAGQYELLCLIRGVLANKKILIVGAFPILETYDRMNFLEVLNMNEATVIKLQFN